MVSLQSWKSIRVATPIKNILRMVFFCKSECVKIDWGRHPNRNLTILGLFLFSLKVWKSMGSSPWSKFDRGWLSATVFLVHGGEWNLDQGCNPNTFYGSTTYEVHVGHSSKTTCFTIQKCFGVRFPLCFLTSTSTLNRKTRGFCKNTVLIAIYHTWRKQVDQGTNPNAPDK